MNVAAALANYALTFAAATLRVELALLIVSGPPGLGAFKTVAWSTWVSNLAIVEGWIRRR